ncbi:NAD-dependent protein deacylase [Tamilnaduibacter salinus]|uniref:NAD-dependent protein deacylase n=1 Tax=Tamilnaduibacter salinus TaxID=1484056 RepID=A0A2A2I056_9GAMM|nr:NAD-dependent deacylase [Tamilnaduibacter salinus]PAV25391.1 NAD-dependent protein deacylase [Tamilnaduibacter salinus]
MKHHIVVITGAGISAESGLSTFRDSGGLWEQVRLEDVATPDAFERDPERVLSFYNRRRRQLQDAEPNDAHRGLAELEERYRVSVVTQNVDDLHERAGSSNVLHLHGKLTQARGAAHPEPVYEIGYRDINPGDTCERGTPLRPNVVWFGEEVPIMGPAAETVATADHLLVIGTSLQVYPAAGLVSLAEPGIPVTVIDPAAVEAVPGAHAIRKTATEGLREWIDRLGDT